MIANMLLPLLAPLAAFTAATTIIQARDASPVAAPAASSSAAVATIEYITYFASTQCEFTSATPNVPANTCTNVGGGGQSFAFDGFGSGPDSCKLKVFSKEDCKGHVVEKLPARSANVSSTCSTATGESMKLVC